MPSQQYVYLNATLVKEVARHGGRVSGLVPRNVERRLRETFAPAAADGARRGRPNGARRTRPAAAKGERR